MDDVYVKALELHEKHRGKLQVSSLIPIENRSDLSLAYTPGVAQVSRDIARNSERSFDLTWRGRTVAVISDGSAVLGLGNIGAEAAMPVMEGKALLFKEFGNVDAVPLCINLHTADEIVRFVKAVAPSFGGINLEDIASPLCIEVEDRLQDIGIPVVHDDQHGTAIVVSAALMNAAASAGKSYEDLRVVISGAGSAGLAITQMLLSMDRKDGTLVPVAGRRVREVVLVDSKGIIMRGRDGVTGWKDVFAAVTNPEQRNGGLAEAMKSMDAFIGVSQGGLVTSHMVSTMGEKPIVLAMANPDPEILPEDARKGGAYIVGTGRSDYPNQINNSLAFPGLFRGLLAARATRVSVGIKQAARDALASSITPTPEAILPPMFAEGISQKIAVAVERQVVYEGLAR